MISSIVLLSSRFKSTLEGVVYRLRLEADVPRKLILLSLQVDVARPDYNSALR